MSPRRVDEDKRATLRRFAALGAGTPLVFGRDREADADESDARAAIRGYVTTTPGAHFSKIRDDLHLGTGETQHHLRRLLDAGHLESHRDGDYRRFFPAGRFTSREQVALGYLRRETPRGMMLYLLRNPGGAASDVADALGVSRPAVSAHAGDLEEAGLLTREDGYAVTDPEMLITLVIRYADTFDADAVSFAASAADVIRFDP